MNSLSWLLFWADVLPSIATWLSILAFILTCVFGFIFAVSFHCEHESADIDTVWDSDENRYVSRERQDTKLYALSMTLRRWGYLSFLFLVLWGAAFLVPSKETFYLIAASEAGEQALQTPEFNRSGTSSTITSTTS